MARRAAPRVSSPRRVVASSALLLALSAGVVAAGCGDDAPPAPDAIDGASPPADAPAAPPDAPGCTAPEDCDDLDPCTADLCEGGACRHVTARDGETCSDGLPCTWPDRCLAGICVGLPLDCAYLTDLCNTGSCEEASGSCVAVPLDDGTACDDGMWCTTVDTCAGGACAGQPRDCSAAADTCNEGVCDEARAACRPMPRAGAIPCEDGLACTAGDTCQAGACAGGPPPACDDGDACTVDRCDPARDACVHERGPLTPPPAVEGPVGAASCGDGLDNDCDGAADAGDTGCRTCASAGECDDGNPCTTDACTGTACAHAPLADGAGCDDGRFCTEPDACVSGVCVGGPARACADGDACTADVCDAAGGACTNPALAIDPASAVATSVDADAPLAACLVAGSDARLVVVVDLRDEVGVPVTGADVTVGGGPALEAVAAPGTYLREVAAAPAPGSRVLDVSATACGATVTLAATVAIDDAPAAPAAGGTGGCQGPDGNLRVRVVAAETGAPLAGASVLVGLAQGTPFETAAEALVGGPGTPGENVALTDAAGAASFRDYGAALAGPITVTAGAEGRAYFTVVHTRASDVVLPLPLLHPLPAPTTTYAEGDAAATVIDCADLDVGLVLPRLDLERFSRVDLDAFFSEYRCWDPQISGVTPMPLPGNLWIPPQAIGFGCQLPGAVAGAPWSLELPDSAATGRTEHVALTHVGVPLGLISLAAPSVEVVMASTVKGLGWILDEDVPTAPTAGRVIAETAALTSAFVVTYAGQPAEADVIAFALADYDGGNGTGGLFILGSRMHPFEQPGSTVAIPNSDLAAAGAPPGVRRLATLSALYLEEDAHPDVPARRLGGVSTVLLRGAEAPPFGPAGGTALVTDFLDIVGGERGPSGELRWDNATRNGHVPRYSRHELMIETSRFMPVLPCYAENELRTDSRVGWIVLKPFGLECGDEECLALPVLPAGFPRAEGSARKWPGLEAVAGSGLVCAGPGACEAGEACVDPDGPGASAPRCLIGAGTHDDPYRRERYAWRLHVYDLGLAAPGWSFDAFPFASHRELVTHESSNLQR